MTATTTATFTWPADPPTRFDSYRDYRTGFTALLTQAQRNLLMFEHDFRVVDLGSRTNCGLLWNFLNGGGELTLIARRAGYIGAEAPRFLRLKDLFGSRVHLLLLQENISTDEPVFILADHRHYLMRHHNNWPRGAAGSDSTVVTFLQHKFHALQISSETASVWRRLDL